MENEAAIAASPIETALKALEHIELISSNHGGWFETDAWEWGQSMGQTAREAVALLRAQAVSEEVSQGATPGAKWREAGEPDPHGLRYNRERASLAMGHLTDDELANDVYLHADGISSIAYLTAAKDRIRWLSRQLDASAQPVASSREGELETQAKEMLAVQYERIGFYHDAKKVRRGEFFQDISAAIRAIIAALQTPPAIAADGEDMDAGKALAKAMFGIELVGPTPTPASDDVTEIVDLWETAVNNCESLVRLLSEAGRPQLAEIYADFNKAHRDEIAHRLAASRPGGDVLGVELEARATVREVGAFISDASEALGLFPSVIRSGETWSPRCDDVLQRARAAISKLGEIALVSSAPTPRPEK